MPQCARRVAAKQTAPEQLGEQQVCDVLEGAGPGGVEYVHPVDARRAPLLQAIRNFDGRPHDAATAFERAAQVVDGRLGAACGLPRPSRPPLDAAELAEFGKRARIDACVAEDVAQHPFDAEQLLDPGFLLPGFFGGATDDQGEPLEELDVVRVAPKAGGQFASFRRSGRAPTLDRGWR